MNRTRLLLIATIASAFIVLVPTMAWAHNTHTVQEWYHGLGDGANDNSYVHPFNDSHPNNHAHPNNRIKLWVWVGNQNLDAEALTTRRCDCQHSHAFWDTTPNRECRYESDHSVGARGNDHAGNADLNIHAHKHHNAC